MNDIKVYGAEWCHDSQRTRRHLNQLGVPYEYINVDEDEAANFWITKQNNGKRVTPTVDLNGTILFEPSDPELDDALKAAGILS